MYIAVMTAFNDRASLGRAARGRPARLLPSVTPAARPSGLAPSVPGPGRHRSADVAGAWALRAAMLQASTRSGTVGSLKAFQHAQGQRSSPLGLSFPARLRSWIGCLLTISCSGCNPKTDSSECDSTDGDPDTGDVPPLLPLPDEVEPTALDTNLPGESEGISVSGAPATGPPCIGDPWSQEKNRLYQHIEFETPEIGVVCPAARLIAGLVILHEPSGFGCFVVCAAR